MFLAHLWNPMCASSFPLGESALGIKAAAIKDGHGEAQQRLVAKPLLPVGEGPCFHCCVTDNSALRGTHPLSTALSGPVGQTPAGTRKLVSAGASAGAAGWLGPGVIQSSLVGVTRELGSSGPAVGLEHLLTWLLHSGGHVPRVACRRVKQEHPPGFFSFQLY